MDPTPTENVHQSWLEELEAQRVIAMGKNEARAKLAWDRIDMLFDCMGELAILAAEQDDANR